LPKLIIDNKEVEFQTGQTILQAAKKAEIKIPHFCWHPGLSIAGNCRICLVEVEKFPKLTISCSTLATEGMIVHTKSEKVTKAQNAVMEFLLINHPLDCPICDEAGECKLQDYAYKYGIGISRFDEEKVHKDKRVELGPNVMFDGDRCISCSRCIRYCEEIAKEPQLTFVERGDRVTIETFPGKKLDNPYSMNVIEICPVGALTSRHFRFRARVWDMSFTDSLCPGCARGCNTIIGVRNNEILRIEPRQNLNVNEYWLCDWGRLNTIKYVSDEVTRVRSPLLRPEAQKMSMNEMVPPNPRGELVAVDWDVAISRIASEIHGANKNILFIASPFSTLEDNYALKKFANEVFNSNDIIYFPNMDESFGDKILKKPDMTPNSTGLKLLGINPVTDKIIEELESGKYGILYVLNENLTRISDYEKIFRKIVLSFHQIVTRNDFSKFGTVILPESSYAEINGTFVNFDNFVQRLKPAVVTLEQERLIGKFSLSRLDKFGAQNDRWTHGKRFNTRPGWKILKQIAKVMGHEFDFENSEEVFIELCSTIPEMKGWDYETIGDKGKQIK
jgi:NADH-quinone oxidoreductase subunit G